MRSATPLRVAVTGATGQIGSAVSLRLAADGCDVVMIDRRQSDRPRADGPLVECDTRDRDRIMAALAGVDVVCHIGEIPNIGAGHSDRDVFDSNTAGCRTMLDAAIACGVRRFIYTSSCQQYGYWGDNEFPTDQPPARWPMDEFQPAAPRNAYAYSKAINEVACRAASARSAMESMIFRFPWVMAPKPNDAKIKNRWVKNDASIGEGFWTYLDLRDAVEAYALAVRPDRPLVPMHARCEAFHFVADDVIGPMSIREKLSRHLPHFAPLPDGWPERRSPISCAKAERFLGWKPAHKMTDVIDTDAAAVASAG